MHVYLAARYERWPEMRVYASVLRGAGHEVTSRWISGDHEVVGSNTALEVARKRKEFAFEDLEDIRAADVVMLFAEIPDIYSRGGRHFEFGYAYAMKKKLVIVGPLENVFHYLPIVKRFDTLEEAIKHLEYIDPKVVEFKQLSLPL